MLGKGLISMQLHQHIQKVCDIRAYCVHHRLKGQGGHSLFGSRHQGRIYGIYS